MTRQSRIIAWLVTAIICVFSTPLFAETKGFQEYLDAAKEAYDKEDYESAIKNLLLANSVENNARLLFNIAKSYQKLESCDKAIVYFTAFGRQPSAGSKLREQALAEIEKSRSCQTVKPLAGRFFIKSDPVGASVTMDGVDLGVTPLEVAGYKSGAHEISFSLDGYQDASQSFEALTGNDQLVSQQLIAAEIVDTTKEVIPPTVEPSAPESSDNLIPLIIAGGITTLGAGVLGFAIYTDTVTVVDLKDERDDLDRNIPEEYTESERLTDEDIPDAITTSLVSYVIGGTLMTGGVGYLVYLLAFDSDNDDASDVVIAPSVNPHGYGISFSSTF